MSDCLRAAKNMPSKVLTTSQRIHATLPIEETIEEDIIEFNWGHKKSIGGPNKDTQFYTSFTYDGVEYFLFDCVYLWGKNEPEPYIGKLISIRETESHKKMVKVVWFFRPIEIPQQLRNVVPIRNEIFLASGEGQGLWNLNPLEAICGKCNVVCISKDMRNPQPSEEELRMADYVFYRTFDVGSCTISHIFADKIAGVKGENFFNRQKNLKLEGVTPVRNPVKVAKSEFIAKPQTKEQRFFNREKNLTLEGVTPVKKPVKVAKFEFIAKPGTKELKISAPSLGKQTCFRNESNMVVRPKTCTDKVLPGDVRIPCTRVTDKNETKHAHNLLPVSSPDIGPRKRRKLQPSTVGSKEVPAKLSDTLPRVADLRVKSVDAPDSAIENLKLSKRDMGDKTESPSLEVTRRPGEEGNNWFKEQPWGEKMRRAHEKGTLVLLENLDASYTSSEVEDIVWHAFKAKVDAKMVQRCTFSSPHHGQAFVIFKSKDAAEFAISELNRKCLMLQNGRPLVGCIGSPKVPSGPTRFVGHLIIDQSRLQKQRADTKNALSTSHFSQPNTIEYEMALEWLALQEKSNRWWNALNAQQAKEIEDLRSRLKIHYNR